MSTKFKYYCMVVITTIYFHIKKWSIILFSNIYFFKKNTVLDVECKQFLLWYLSKYIIAQWAKL